MDVLLKAAACLGSADGGEIASLLVTGSCDGAAQHFSPRVY